VKTRFQSVLSNSNLYRLRHGAGAEVHARAQVHHTRGPRRARHEKQGTRRLREQPGLDPRRVYVCVVDKTQSNNQHNPHPPPPPFACCAYVSHTSTSNSDWRTHSVHLVTRLYLLHPPLPPPDADKGCPQDAQDCDKVEVRSSGGRSPVPHPPFLAPGHPVGQEGPINPIRD
jgi:hypothetical protein